MLSCLFYPVDKASALTHMPEVKIDVTASLDNYTCSWSAEEATQQIKLTVHCADGADVCEGFDKVWDQTAADAGLTFINQNYMIVDPMNSME